MAYGSRLALGDVTASAPPGRLICLLGLNGAGKSTLLKAVVGMVPASGQAAVLGATGRHRRRLVAYLPQREEINWDFPITVLEVVLMGRAGSLRRLGLSSREDREAGLAALGQVEMRDSAAVPVGELSGGQQQRVLLARALYSEAPVMLLDEPLTGVDAATREVVLEVLRRACERGHTILMATHDVLEAARIGDRVWGLNRTVVVDVPGSRLLEEEHLRRIYGDRLLVLPQGSVALGDDAR